MNENESRETSSPDSKVESFKPNPLLAESGTEHNESGQGSVCKLTVTFGEEPGDIIINTGDKRFSCHKSVLIQHSLYFQAMFDSGMKESRSSEVLLEDISSLQFQHLLEYFYTGDLNLTSSNVQEMSEVSNHLQVSVVLDQCCDLLLTMIEDDLCLSLMRLSNMLTLSEVYNQSRRHALWHFHRVSHTEDFILAPCVQIVDYLQDPHLNIDQETEVFRAAAMWYSSQEEPWEVSDVMEFFGSAVNFHLMTEDEVALLEDLPVVAGNQSLSSFVASLKQKDVHTRLCSKDPTRVRTSPRNGRILCVGAHQCLLSDCQGTCPYAQHQSAPLDVLAFEPDACCLEPLASLSDNYPALALDSGYRVCAIGHLVYVVGGEATLGHTGGWLTTIWCLDSLRGSWHKAGTLPQVRRHHGLCAHGTTLFLIGGIGRFRVRLESVESFDTDTKDWHQLPDMLYQETSPAVTWHRGRIYVFKNYAQVFHIATSTWTFLKLFTPIPGLPIYAHSHPSPHISSIFVSCFNSESLWIVNLEKKETELVTKFEKEGGGGVLCKGCFYHFQVHEAGSVKDTHVECYNVKEKLCGSLGVLKGAVMTSHFVTVPGFPRFTPSSSDRLF